MNIAHNQTIRTFSQIPSIQYSDVGSDIPKSNLQEINLGEEEFSLTKSFSLKVPNIDNLEQYNARLFSFNEEEKESETTKEINQNQEEEEQLLCAFIQKLNVLIVNDEVMQLMIL
jgi:hypothetical protein